MVVPTGIIAENGGDGRGEQCYVAEPGNALP
jgi:hypothetical protein